jgi:hypothetical protein
MYRQIERQIPTDQFYDYADRDIQETKVAEDLQAASPFAIEWKLAKNCGE